MKKLNKGMTLVEIVVAMAIFSTMTLGITMAFAAAIKYNARNIRRDYELNLQQTAIEKSTAAGVEVFIAEDGSHSFQTRKLQFVKPGGSITAEIEDVSQYNAIKSAQSGNDFNFELKTFASDPLGSTACSWDPTAGTYKIVCTNQSTNSVDVRLETTMGTIYEGDPSSGYRHSSNIYKRSILGIGSMDISTGDETTSPSGFVIGYDNPSLASETSSMALYVYVDGSLRRFHELNNYQLMSSSEGVVNIVVNADGTVSVHY